MKKPYKLAVCVASDAGFSILLDGNQARTPMGNPLILPKKLLGEAVAQEWQTQNELIRKETMPLTQTACVAIDLATKRADEVIADILPYADTDLICYRAGDVPVLLAEQAALLDPIVAWANEQFGVVLHITQDVMPIAQPEDNKTKLLPILESYDSWKLAAFAGLVKPLGSFILALALVEGRIDAETAFALSQLEETYETEKWGPDEEKEARLKALKSDILAIGRFIALTDKQENSPI